MWKPLLLLNARRPPLTLACDVPSRLLRRRTKPSSSRGCTALRFAYKAAISLRDLVALCMFQNAMGGASRLRALSVSAPVCALAQLVEDVGHICRQWRYETALFHPRQRDAYFCGVKRHAGDQRGGADCASAIERIAEDGQAVLAEVHADLVGATCLQLALHEYGPVAELFERFEMGDGLPCSLASAVFSAVAGGAPVQAFDRAFGL